MRSRQSLRFRYAAWRPAAVRLLALLITLLGSSRLSAVGPPLQLTQYAHTAWISGDGALKSGVRAITQTRDGYLWLATEFGLVRFDGVRFAEWHPPKGQDLPSSNIRTLLASRDGSLWIGTLEGLASWKDGKLTVYPETANQNVTALIEDRDGTVWAGTFSVPKARLCAIRQALVQCSGDDGVFGEWVWSLYEDSSGRIWAGAETGLWRWKPGPPKRYPTPHPIETAQSITETGEHNGPIVVGEGMWQLSGEKIKEYSLDTPPGRLITPVNAFVDRNGELWVGTLQDGILHVDRGKTSFFAQSEGLSSDRVLTIFEDREGNIWVGTTDGLDRFHRSSVYSLSVRQGLSSRSVWSVLGARDQSVWVTTLDGVNRWKDGHVTVYSSAAGESERLRAIQHRVAVHTGLEPAVTERTDAGLPDNRVGSLFEDERGRVWVSTPRGIARFQDGKFTHIKELPPGWVNVFATDKAGGVWISYQDEGLVHWSEGKVLERIPWSKLGGGVIASSLAPDPKGGLWLGFFQGGVVYLKDGEVRARYGSKDGLGSGRVMDLQADSDGSVWAATESGLSLLNRGHLSTLTNGSGLPCKTVHWARHVEDSFWLYTACGLVRISDGDMQRWRDNPNNRIQFTLFDNYDGVRSHALLTGYTPRVSVSADGKLWFAHFESVSVVDVHDLQTNTIPPPVRIEQITGDGVTHEAVNGLQLQPRTRDLSIDYTAMSLTAPEKIQFRVKLEGQDVDWRVPGNPRHAHYTNLAPRRYIFRVIASNNSGLWNEEGAVLEFVIPPAWYQTTWFRLACLAVLLAAIWLVYHIRARQQARQFNLMVETRVGERMRIARELHDTLLQNFQAILPRIQAALYKLPEGAVDARNTLESTIDLAARAITDGRDAVQGLRLSPIEINDLAVAIRSVGEELATASPGNPPRFEVVVEGATRELDPISRDEVYRVAAEALRNAFLHAQARAVEVEIRYGEKYFELHVRDDGKGMDRDIVEGQGRAGHFGLRGMHERAKLMGGRLSVWSDVGAGTEIELKVPASQAYPKVVRRPWFVRDLSKDEADTKEEKL